MKGIRAGAIVKRIGAILIMAAVMVTHAAKIMASDAPYTTLTEDSEGRLVQSQHGYLPAETMTTINEESLNKPSDLFIDRYDQLYIADTGNKRIVVATLDGELIRIFGEEQLDRPTGLYVDDTGTVYVADPGLKQVVAFDPNGEMIRSYERPTETLFGQNNPFVPQKVALDRGKNLYLISEGNTNGLAQLSNEGEFLGYFGANHTRLGISEIVRRLLFSKDQRNQLRLNVPSSPHNLDIDEHGLVHTVTKGEGKDGLKKFNMAGVNMLDQGNVDNAVSDVATGSIENIFAVSSAGYIYEYTREGDLLFFFGGSDDGRSRNGLFVSAVAIDVDSKGNLYVLDQESQKIEIFSKTEYATLVHHALSLYQEGKYIESKEPWETVLHRNGLFDYAYRGIGQAYYKLEDYDDALRAFRRAGDKPGYSDSYWEVRNDFLRSKLGYILGALLLLALIRHAYGKLKAKYAWTGPVERVRRRLQHFTLYQELAYLAVMPRNPADAYYGIRREHRVSVLSASIYYLLFFILYVVNKYFSAFLFKRVLDGHYELLSDALRVGGVLILFLASHHLIASIREGEGTFRDVYCGLAYALMPYIVLKPFVIVLTYVLTFNESFIITLMNVLIAVGVGVMVFLMIKEIQNYTLKETVINILLTAFTMAIFIVAGTIIVSLIMQVVDFLTSLMKEVSLRVQ